MKKYILIQNDGEIESNSFELIGASTKRNEEGKIGFFGSGLKYSIAYMMRNGIEFKVFSGNKEMVFTTKQEQLKEQSFERICINGNETSFTTTMGPTWTQDWFVLREIYCNAIDETNCMLVKSTEDVNPSEGKTRIYIQLTDSLQTVVDNWDSYFADERTPLFTTKEIFTCYLGHEDMKPTSYQSVNVYKKTEGIIYRRGIRVYKAAKYHYDYGCDAVNINEDRTAKNPTGIHYAILGIFSSFSDEGYIKNILRTGKDEKPSEEFIALSCSSSINGNASQDWIRFSKENLLVIKEISGRYSEQIDTSKKEVFYLPSIFARCLKKDLPSMDILGMSSVIGDDAMQEVETTSKMNFLLKEVLSSLSEMKYDVHYDIKVVEFDNDQVLGSADIENKRVLLSAQVFDMGRREIAMTIMEECEHIKSGKGDETRAFQTHIFSQWLKMIEEANGLFL